MKDALFYVYRKSVHDGRVRLLRVYVTLDELFLEFDRCTLLDGFWLRPDLVTMFGTDLDAKWEVNAFGNTFAGHVLVCYADDKTLVQSATLLGWYREYRARKNRYRRFNKHPGRKRNHYSGYRSPGVNQEMRHATGWLPEDLEPAPRPARNAQNLRYFCDDNRRWDKTRSWKAYRRHQWR